MLERIIEQFVPGDIAHNFYKHTENNEEEELQGRELDEIIQALNQEACAPLSSETAGPDLTVIPNQFNIEKMHQLVTVGGAELSCVLSD